MRLTILFFEFSVLFVIILVWECFTFSILILLIFCISWSSSKSLVKHPFCISSSKVLLIPVMFPTISVWRPGSKTIGWNAPYTRCSWWFHCIILIPIIIPTFIPTFCCFHIHSWNRFRQSHFKFLIRNSIIPSPLPTFAASPCHSKYEDRKNQEICTIDRC